MSTTTQFSLKVQPIIEKSHYREIYLDEKNFESVKTLCENRTNMAGFFKASVLPIRTDVTFLLSDLLLPNFINGALKINDRYIRNIAGLLSFVWDISTLPLRLITYIPRHIYNLSVKQKEHPLIPYLKENGFPKEMQTGLFKIELLKKCKIPGATLKDEKTHVNGFQYKIELADRESPIFCPLEGTIENGLSTLSSNLIGW
ncbi:MAG: hypothetical protein K1000chlam2_00830 [Chlamydiae bacterium]|nr:hypothetical protein [Chlamydiota bacterium]